MEEGNINTPEEWNRVYSEGFYQDVATPDREISFNLIDEAIDIYDTKFLPTSILHVACGLDQIGNYLWKKTGSGYIISTDYSEVAISESIKRFPDDKVKRLIFSIEETCVGTKNQDMIVALEVLEHFKAPSVPVRQMFQALKKGGILVFSTPYKLGKYANIEYHYSQFDKDSLADLLFSCGFSRVTFINHPYNFHQIAGVAFK